MQRQAEPFPSFKFYAVVWRHDDGSAHVTATGSSAIALCRIRKHASQSPSRCVVSQFLLGCSTRFREACCRRLYFRLEWRVLQEFYALCYHLLTLSCVSHPVVYIFFVLLCHTLLLFFHFCVCERMPQCGAMFCLYVKSPIYDILTQFTEWRAILHASLHELRTESVYISKSIYFFYVSSTDEIDPRHVSR